MDRLDKDSTIKDTLLVQLVISVIDGEGSNACSLLNSTIGSTSNPPEPFCYVSKADITAWKQRSDTYAQVSLYWMYFSPLSN